MTTLRVRCCCQPEKVLGTLDFGMDIYHPGHYKVPVWDGTHGNMLDFDFDVMEWIDVIEVKRFCHLRAGDYELAVYSDDRPLDYWDNIRGFKRLRDQGDIPCQPAPTQPDGRDQCQAIGRDRDVYGAGDED